MSSVVLLPPKVHVDMELIAADGTVDGDSTDELRRNSRVQKLIYHCSTEEAR